MTPKEKAAELMKLFDVKYLRIMSFTGKVIPVSMYDDQIKGCALMGVDLVMESNSEVKHVLEFWQEVKKEIEAL